MSSELCRELAALLAQAESARDMEMLVEGLLTPAEVEEVMRRWRLLKRLTAGQTQREISREMKVSLGKISRGSLMLKYGLPEFTDLMRRIERPSEDSTE